MTVSCGREWGALDAHKPIGDGQSRAESAGARCQAQSTAREWVSPWVVVKQRQLTQTAPATAIVGLKLAYVCGGACTAGGYWLMMADDREEAGQDGSPPMRLSRSVVSG